MADLLITLLDDLAVLAVRGPDAAVVPAGPAFQ